MSGFGGERLRQWSIDSSSSTDPTTISKDSPSSWRDFGMSMNAISFGFAATAVLIAMFLLMALFEHFIKPRISNSLSLRTRGTINVEIVRPHDGPHGKVHTSSKVEAPLESNYSVLMPGQHYPTYLAQPAPLPCEREGIHWPPHEPFAFCAP
ncbi:hypothetical protein LUZ60_001848 [Juncus effusus]|nr:hypothetical protein LUZ60_001848 [Juncus effusus]